MIEKWRVIDESGATHEVDVTSDGSAHPLWTTRAVYRGIEQKTFPTATARRSVLRWAVASDVQPVEILAPGQPSRTTPAWGPLPTAAEVEAHVARSAPARRNSGAPWARKHGDSSGEGVSIVYLAVIGDRVQFRAPTGGVWYAMTDRDRAAQWRSVDADGVAVERAR